MKKRNITLAIVATAGVLGAGSLWAHEGEHENGSDTSSNHGEMMQDGKMMQDGMGMRNMMGQMESMMEKCHSMMDMMMMQQDHHPSTDSGQTDS